MELPSGPPAQVRGEASFFWRKLPRGSLACEKKQVKKKWPADIQRAQMLRKMREANIPPRAGSSMGHNIHEPRKSVLFKTGFHGL